MVVGKEKGVMKRVGFITKRRKSGNFIIIIPTYDTVC
jgi:hypothetical protein